MIIESPHLQTLWQRFSNTVLTFVFWVFWIYLFLPVISFMAWIFGIRTYYNQIVIGQSWDKMENDLLGYSLIGISIAAIYIFWALYNYFRFVGNCRRTFQPKVSDKDMKELFHINTMELATMRRADVVLLRIDEKEAHLLGA